MAPTLFFSPRLLELVNATPKSASKRCLPADDVPSQHWHAVLAGGALRAAATRGRRSGSAR
jgi:hypothetical protein